MRVALDGTPLLGVRTGVGAFCREALAALSKRTELDVSAFAVSWRRRAELKPQLPKGVGNDQLPMPARPLQWSWAHLPGPPVEWFIGPTDVVHGTNYVVPPTSRAARVVSVHDLTFLRFPQLCDPPSLAFGRLVRRAVDHGAWVHTLSHFVAKEVVSELGVDEERVVAVHLGIPSHHADLEPPVRANGDVSDHENFEPESEAPATDQAAPVARGPAAPSSAELVVLRGALAPGVSRYVLAIGTIEPRKDYPTLVLAFDKLTADVKDVALVIAGGQGWGSESFSETLAMLKRPDRVSCLGYVDDADLQLLLRGAAAVAYPSVYEGFGFVPLEAMAAGVPVVTTSAGAIPEVVGEAALLVPPGDADALADALLRLLEDGETAFALVERGLRRAEGFTWSACAAGLSALYAKAAHQVGIVR
jgi:glycosyltransferase involved in cell wall biosynthesis